MAEQFDDFEDAGVESAEVVTKYSEAGRIANGSFAVVLPSISLTRDR